MVDQGLVRVLLTEMAGPGPGPGRDLDLVTGDLDITDITATGGTATVRGEFRIQNILTDLTPLTVKEI